MVLAIGDSKGGPGGPRPPLLKNNFLKNLGEKLLYRLALLFLAFFMFLEQILGCFQAFKLQKSCSFWGLHPQTPLKILLYTIAKQQ